MNDDLDEEIIDSEDGFDDFSEKSSDSTDFKKSPIVKIGVVLGVVGALVVAMQFLDQEEMVETQSSLPAGKDVTSIPATDDKVDPIYMEAVEEQNEADLERALSVGDSAIPVPIETPETRLDVPEREEVEEDPLHKWRMLQAEQAVRDMKTLETEAEPVTVLDNQQQNEAINALSESMMKQMNLFFRVLLLRKRSQQKHSLSTIQILAVRGQVLLALEEHPVMPEVKRLPDLAKIQRKKLLFPRVRLFTGRCCSKQTVMSLLSFWRKWLADL